MAQAGFYRTLNSSAPDDVECFVCFITLSGWEANEEPFEEHNAHSPECPFAQARKPQDELKVGEWIEVLRVRNDKINVSQLGQCDNVCKSLCLFLLNMRMNMNRNGNLISPPQTHTQERRLKSMQGNLQEKINQLMALCDSKKD